MSKWVRRFVDFGIRLGTRIVLLLTVANTAWFLANCASAEFRMLGFETHGFAGPMPSLRGVLFAALGPLATAGYIAIATLILIANVQVVRRALRGELPVPERELWRFGRAFGLVMLGLVTVVMARVVLGWVQLPS